MTDPEAIKLCAIAMGEQIRDDLSYLLYWHNSGWAMYDPLHDDAQAMALVKRFEIILDRAVNYPKWTAHPYGEESFAFDDDPNRAIVMCVAAMQDAPTSNSAD